MRKINLLVILLALFAACGPTQRQRTLKATLITVNAARDGFLAWNLEHQKALVASASGNKDAARAKVVAYREERESVVESFVKIYQLIAKAALLSEDAKALTDVLFSAKSLEADLKALKERAP